MRLIGHLLAVCVAAIASAMPPLVAAADAAVASRELTSVGESKKVTTAFWTRREDSYTLQVMVPVPHTGANIVACLATDPAYGLRSRRVSVDPPSNPARGVTLDDMRRLGIVNVSDALLNLAVRPLNVPPPRLIGGGRTDATPALSSQIQSPKVIQVWLLRADGTQILPIATAAGLSSERTCGPLREPMEASTRAGRYDDEITYRFPLAASEQAVAAVFMFDDAFYIEKLQPQPQPQPPPQAR